jgi:hypothetical protein
MDVDEDRQIPYRRQMAVWSLTLLSCVLKLVIIAAILCFFVITDPTKAFYAENRAFALLKYWCYCNGLVSQSGC